MGIFLLIVGVTVAIVIPISSSNWVFHKNKYNIVLTVKNGHQDQGFEQQAVEGVCLAFNIQPKNCNASHQLFKEGKISYSYPGTMDKISLIKKYIDNYVEIDQTNFFIMSAGWFFQSFLKKWLFDDQSFLKKGINFIALGTSFDPKKIKDWPQNFWQVLFEDYLPGYYAGLYAGAYALLNPDQFKDADDDTDGKQIHFSALGVLTIAPVVRFALGFKLGISVINEKRDQFTDTDTEVLFSKYQNNDGWDEPLQTKTNAEQMFIKDKISVIFSIGSVMTTAIQAAAKEADKDTNTNHHWVVGVDIDQGLVINNENQQSSTRKGKILVSALKKCREKVADLIKKIDQEKETTGRSINVEKAYLDIPQRFKNDDEWKRVETVILNQEIEPAKKIMQTMRQWVANDLDNEFKNIEKFLNSPDKTDFSAPSP